MSIAAIGAAMASSASVPTLGGAQGAAAVSPTSGADFANALAGGVQNLSDVQNKADQLGVKAATGDLSDAADYTVAATQAELTTELTVTLRNKAIDAFNEIMRMQA